MSDTLDKEKNEIIAQFLGNRKDMSIPEKMKKIGLSDLDIEILYKLPISDECIESIVDDLIYRRSCNTRSIEKSIQND